MTNETTAPFELINSCLINTLGITLEHYRHTATGADHYHFASDSDENVFMVALRTLPHDSTGVAHILEHTVLCGSEKYPVRDPFFMMIRRSLNTFMNAFTSSDWTAYPFASQNKKDFNNLLDVYLDAVFFSRLHELDFAQEGHRVEFADANNPASELVYKGVVFNEMKGAMSSISSTLWHTLCEHLFKETTYHYNSGGDPEVIPDLSYEQLKEFYRTHYHPSNAIFMTFGDIPAAEHQSKIQAQVLARFPEAGQRFSVDDEPRFAEALRVTERYALDAAEGIDTADKNHFVMGWLLGKSVNLDDMFTAHLVSSVLLDNSASPLQHALETTDLGSSPSPLCGLEDSNRELIFVCGLEGCADDSSAAVEQLILDTLEDVAENGVPQEQVESVLHQLELHQREIGGDGYPYGLQIMLQTITAATHGGAVEDMLNIEASLERLRDAIQDPNYVKNLVRELLINNQHRVSLTMTPDTTLSAQRDSAEKARLEQLKQELDAQQADAIVAKAKALETRQAQIDDDSVLPKVTLHDVPPDIRIIEAQQHQPNDVDCTVYIAGTNGICYQQIVFPLPDLSVQEEVLLPYYTQALTELGVGARDYRATQAWQSAVSGGLNAYSTVRGDVDDEQRVRGYVSLSSKALNRNHADMNALMLETLQAVRFDEHSHMREMVAHIKARKEQSVTGNGHTLAMLAASAGFSPAADLSNRLSGLPSIRFVKQLDKNLKNEDAIEQFAQALATLHQRIIAQPMQVLLISDSPDNAEHQLNTIGESWPAFQSKQATSALNLLEQRENRREIWIANTQVNFCATAYPSVPIDHPDSAALTVLGPFLRNGYLHRAIREQGGAYGGGAGQDSNSAAFRFFSYRDPRIEGTLEDFEASLRWLQTHDHTPQSLEEAILGVIGSLDKPGSPAGEAKGAFQNKLFDRTDEQRRRFRSRVLETTISDLQRVASLYLRADKASVVVITNAGGAKPLTFEAQRFQLD